MTTLSPYFTKPGKWTLGRDPLGMQASSVRIYRELVPGLTNVTNRLRYYSFYCWVVRHYQTTVHADDVNQWAKFIRRAEALYAIASQLHEPDEAVGLGGGNWAYDQRQKGIPETFRFKTWTDSPGEAGQYLKAKRGNFGQFYIASMQSVGLLERTRSVPVVTADRGTNAAKAFQKSVGNAIDSLEEGIEKGRLTKNELKKLGKAVHPSNIPEASNEMALLRNFVLDKDGEWHGARRRHSALVMLDIMDKAGEYLDDNALRRVFYYRSLLGEPYTVGDGKLEETLDIWQAYQANEICHVALAALMNGITARLKKKDECDPNVLVQEFTQRIFGKIDGAKTWSAWATDTAAEYKEKEDDLIDGLLAYISKVEQPDTTTTFYRAAVRLLGMIWARWHAGPNSVTKWVGKIAGDYPSVIKVLDTMNAVSGNDREQVIRAVVKKHILDGHLLIAGRKLNFTGSYTYHFREADGVLSDGVIGEYTLTNPRLGNLATFLGDAKYHEDRIINAAGREVLRAR